MSSVIFKLTAMTGVVLVGFAVAYQAQLSLSENSGVDSKDIFNKLAQEGAEPKVDLGNEVESGNFDTDKETSNNGPDYNEFARGLELGETSGSQSSKPKTTANAAPKRSANFGDDAWDDELTSSLDNPPKNDTRNTSNPQTASNTKSNSGIVPVQFEEDAENTFEVNSESNFSSQSPEPIDQSLADESQPLQKEPVDTGDTQLEPDFFGSEEETSSAPSDNISKFTRDSGEPSPAANETEPKDEVPSFDPEFGISVDDSSDTSPTSNSPEVVEPDFAFDEPETPTTKKDSDIGVSLEQSNGEPQPTTANSSDFDPFEPETDSEKEPAPPESPAESQQEPAAFSDVESSTQPLFPELSKPETKENKDELNVQPEEPSSESELVPVEPKSEPTEDTSFPEFDTSSSSDTETPAGFTPVKQATPSVDESKPEAAASESTVGNVPNSSSQTNVEPAPIANVGQSAQLTIKKKAPPHAVLGKPMVYDIVVKNIGNQAAEKVRVEDHIPKGTELVGTIPGAKKKESTLFWDIASLAPGEEKIISVKVIPTSVGQVGSVATVNFISEVVTDTAITAPKLELDVDISESSQLGEKFKLAFHVHNKGGAKANNVVLRQNLPSQLNHVSGRNIQYEVGELLPGSSKKVELILTAAAPGSGITQSVLTADGNIKIEKQKTISVVGQSLVVTRTGPKRRYLGREGVYINSVTNNSDAAVYGIVVTEQLPKGMLFVEAPESGVYDANSNSVTWRFPSLAARETKVFRVKLRAQSLGSQASSVRVNSQNGQQASIEAQTIVSGFSHVDVDVPAVDGPVEVGEPFAVRIVAKNRGTSTATGIKVRITIPPEMQFVSAKSGLKYTRVGNRILFAPVATLERQEHMEFQMVLKASAAGTSKLRVEVEADQAKEPFSEEESLVILPRTE